MDHWCNSPSNIGKIDLNVSLAWLKVDNSLSGGINLEITEMSLMIIFSNKISIKVVESLRSRKMILKFIWFHGRKSLRPYLQNFYLSFWDFYPWSWLKRNFHTEENMEQTISIFKKLFKYDSYKNHNHFSNPDVNVTCYEIKESG